MANHRAAAEVLLFWFGEGEAYGKRDKRWFVKDQAFDKLIRDRFLGLYEALAAGSCRDWLQRPDSCLARVLVLDQFPRNMFRGTPRAFATDAAALDAARHGLAQGFDRAMLPVERMFLYLPFEHSESLADQIEACRLMEPLRAFAETADAYDYALRHRDIIERFGRFSHRNSILGRASTPEEIEFLKQPGSGF